MVSFKQREFRARVEFGALTRIFHWIRAFSITMLVITGFYMAYPFLHSVGDYHQIVLDSESGVVVSAYTSYLQGYIRFFHVSLGFVLIAIAFFRLYLFFFDKHSAPERQSVKQAFDVKVWIAQIKNYLFIGKHPHIKGAYNPIQFVAYFVLGLLTLFISLTGVVLYYNVYDDGLGGVLKICFTWFEVMCGGLANVRDLHHIITWGFILFVPVHIYMAVFNSVYYPNGGIDAMISGIRYDGKEHN